MRWWHVLTNEDAVCPHPTSSDPGESATKALRHLARPIKWARTDRVPALVPDLEVAVPQRDKEQVHRDVGVRVRTLPVEHLPQAHAVAPHVTLQRRSDKVGLRNGGGRGISPSNEIGSAASEPGPMQRKEHSSLQLL